MLRSLRAALAAALLLQACTRAGTPASQLSAATAPASIVTASAKSRIDSTLRAYVSSGRLVGVSAVVWEKGQERYYGAYGVADREAGRPMQRDAIVQIYSMTKPITGVALMTLYEQGKFKLDEPLAKYLPEFANPKVYAGTDPSGQARFVPADRPITIADITRHTAGFATSPGEPGVGRLYAAADPLARTNTITQFSHKLASVPLAFQPGTRWSYGISVDVQAALVERISGQPFGEYVRQHVLDPLKMRETRYLVPTSDQRRLAVLYQRRPTGGSAAGVEWQRTPDSTYRSFNTQPWPLEPGAFGLTSTLDDYLRFTRMLLNGGELDGVRILKPETIQLMATNHLPATVKDSSFLPSKGQVGFGIDFAVRVAPPKSAAENNGAVGEFFWDGLASTVFWVDPKNQLTAVLFTQMLPFDQVKLHKSFRDAVYGPITSPLQ
jgi:CubicO group peptidase (beta-lactamase class C family)